MPDSLIAKLHSARVSCRALAAWSRCEGGRKDRCESCVLGGPELCDRQVIEALVERIVTARGQTDEALLQRDYWKGVADRCASVTMERERSEEE